MRPACFVLLLAAPELWAQSASAPDLERHTHASGVFSYETPRGWSVRLLDRSRGLEEAAGEGQIVRFVYAAGETGYDALHVSCMLERLAPESETLPRLRYEYDFVSATLGDYRLLDSAFEVTYEAEIAGQRTWRQRNVTLVGKGHSLCVILHAPARLWKESKAARALQETVLRSLVLP